jgi:hypothetical protein
MLNVQNFQELTGTEYLMAEIACKHDKAFEKEQWNDRLAHFHSLDLDDSRIYKKASNAPGLRAAVLAYRKAQKGEPSGYMISLDASSSGLQFLSLLVSCPKSWALCGGDESVLDSYAALYQTMEVGKGLTRKDIKRAIMTALYGSTATPEEVFGPNIDLFYETMETEAPGAWDLNLGLQELWDDIPDTVYSWVLPDNFHAVIETQDRANASVNFLGGRFDVPVKVDQKPRFHKGLGPNLIHSVDGFVVREMLRRCMFKEEVTTRVMDLILNPVGAFIYGTNGKSADMVQTLWDWYLETGILSVRILDYLYEDTMGLVDPMVVAKLLQSLPDQSFDVVTVHDCFRCHPNYGNDLRRQYNTILADINDSTLLKSIASQVVNREVKVRKHGKIDREVILNGNYLLG